MDDLLVAERDLEGEELNLQQEKDAAIDKEITRLHSEKEKYKNIIALYYAKLRAKLHTQLSSPRKQGRKRKVDERETKRFLRDFSKEKRLEWRENEKGEGIGNLQEVQAVEDWVVTFQFRSSLGLDQSQSVSLEVAPKYPTHVSKSLVVTLSEGEIKQPLLPSPSALFPVLWKIGKDEAKQKESQSTIKLGISSPQTGFTVGFVLPFDRWPQFLQVLSCSFIENIMFDGEEFLSYNNRQNLKILCWTKNGKFLGPSSFEWPLHPVVFTAITDSYLVRCGWNSFCGESKIEVWKLGPGICKLRLSKFAEWSYPGHLSLVEIMGTSFYAAISAGKWKGIKCFDILTGKILGAYVSEEQQHIPQIVMRSFPTLEFYLLCNFDTLLCWKINGLLETREIVALPPNVCEIGKFRNEIFIRQHEKSKSFWKHLHSNFVLAPEIEDSRLYLTNGFLLLQNKSKTYIYT